MTYDDKQQNFHNKVTEVMQQYACDYYEACGILARRSAAKQARLARQRRSERDAAKGRVCLPPGDR
jgi:hypothetical protein